RRPGRPTGPAEEQEAEEEQQPAQGSLTIRRPSPNRSQGAMVPANAPQIPQQHNPGLPLHRRPPHPTNRKPIPQEFLVSSEPMSQDQIEQISETTETEQVPDSAPQSSEPTEASNDAEAEAPKIGRAHV